MPLRPSPIVGAPLDRALRRSLLRYYTRMWERYDSAPLRRLWETYLESLGCINALDLAHRIAVLYDPPTADVFRDTLERWLSARAGPLSDFHRISPHEALVGLPALLESQHAAVPEDALCALPEEEFLTAIQVAMQMLSDHEAATLASHINRVFATIGVAYRHGTVDGEPDWYSEPPEFYRLLDPELERQTVEPALRALTDARLTTSAKEFHDGLRRVAKVDTSDLDDAVLDFGRAVTEALHALACTTGGNPKGGTAGALFGHLRNSGVLPPDSEWLILSANKLRNPVEHQRGIPSNTDQRTAQAALGAASTAITYIASFLPPQPAAQTATVPSTADDDIPF